MNITKDFILQFDRNDIGNVWRMQITPQYQQFIDKKFIMPINKKHIRRNVTPWMVKCGRYFAVAPIGEQLIWFNEL